MSAFRCYIIKMYKRTETDLMRKTQNKIKIHYTILEEYVLALKKIAFASDIR